MASPDEFKHTLKALVVKECDKDFAADHIKNDEQLIGGPLGLDSLDALQICMAIKDRYGVRIEGGPISRKALASIDALAEFIEQEAPGTTSKSA